MLPSAIATLSRALGRASGAAPALDTVQATATSDRHVVRRAVLVVGLGNYTHPTTRHSIGQYVLAPLLRAAEAHDRRVRAEIAFRVSKLKDDAPRHVLPVPAPTDALRLVRHAHGWLARVSVLLDSAPPKGAAARRAPSFSLDAYPYVLLDMLLFIPQQLMNVSGGAVKAALQAYPTLGVEDVILVHDEMQRAFGKVTFKAGGSATGHNGIKSVQDVLHCHGPTKNEPDVARVRVGIGRPDDGDVVRFVMGEMPPAWLEACDGPPAAPGDESAPGPIARDVLQVLAEWTTQRVAPTT